MKRNDDRKGDEKLFSANDAASPLHKSSFKFFLYLRRKDFLGDLSIVCFIKMSKNKRKVE